MGDNCIVHLAAIKEEQGHDAALCPGKHLPSTDMGLDTPPTASVAW